MSPNPGSQPLGRDIAPLPADYHVPGRFAGKTLLVTGAARGIGKATAVRAAREGAQVMLADALGAECRATAAQITSTGGKAAAIEIDIRSDADNQRMVAETVAVFGRLDAALNNAGVMDAVPPQDAFNLSRQRDQMFAPIHQASDAYWDQCFAVNVTGMFYSLRHELRQLLTQNTGGAIVNVGSIAGLIGLGGCPAYNASKHAVTGLTRNAAIDYAPYGVRINSVNMAATETHMTASAFQKVMAMEEEKQQLMQIPAVANTALAKTQSLLAIADSKHRMSTPEEQAAVILFLLSPEASNITGAAWATDGGWTTY